jgi:predicted RNA-binding protein YlxR (DUF448 family)
LPAPRASRRTSAGIRRQPQRTCVSCRETNDKRTLTRLVRTPDGHVRLDTTGRAPGRGAYLCTQRECWERALGRADTLGRALKVSVPAEDRTALLAEAPAPSTAGGRDETDSEAADSSRDADEGARP